VSIALVGRTSHLELIAATVAHLDAELEGPEALGALLGVAVPVGWPPGDYDRNAMEFFKAQLEAAGESAVGWYNWYAMAVAADGRRNSLVAGAGYLGPPADDGSVEIGYSVVAAARRRGYATELVEFLAARAFKFHPVQTVVAHTLDSNAGSAGVLLRCGFVRVGPGTQAGTVRYERRRASSAGPLTGGR
jgi:[ribosomal protein S5]-alanine N-acetyltransferase